MFERETISDNMYEKLKNLNDALKKAEDKSKRRNKSFVELEYHPSEIIYKYLAMIAWDRGDREASDILISKVAKCLVDEGDIIRLIRKQGVWEYYKHVGNIESADRAYSDLVMFINLSSMEFLRKLDTTDTNIVTDFLNNRLTYMYI